jgi:hypothetical protein
VEKTTSGSAAGELLIPIQVLLIRNIETDSFLQLLVKIQADIRRIHLKAGFGKEEMH